MRKTQSTRGNKDTAWLIGSYKQRKQTKSINPNEKKTQYVM